MIPKSQLKYIQSLGQKKHRDDHHVFIAEGPKLVAEFLQYHPSQIQTIFATESWMKDRSSLYPAIDFVVVSDKELERISQLVTPHDVLAVCRQFEIREPVVQGKLTLVLDEINDPGNMGTIIRIADWFSISQVICSLGCVDLYNPKTVQASMGSIARVSIYYTELVQWVKQQQIPVYAAIIGGNDVRAMKKPEQGLIVIGNESRGIRQEILQRADEKISIPGKGGAESLNAAVATGIILSFLT